MVFQAPAVAPVLAVEALVVAEVEQPQCLFPPSWSFSGRALR
jgi:hypothetical protein